jgi:hypothetical protein
MLAWGVKARAAFLDLAFIDAAMGLGAQHRMAGQGRIEKAVLVMACGCRGLPAMSMRRRGGVCYSRQLASHTDINMIETNPILAQIADIRGRVESLRGYL